MPRLAAALIAATLVAGCTTWDLGIAWTRPNTMMQQTTFDNVNCARLAEEVKRSPETVLGGMLDLGMLTITELDRISQYSDCMTSKGYVKSGYMKL